MYGCSFQFQFELSDIGEDELFKVYWTQRFSEQKKLGNLLFDLKFLNSKTHGLHSCIHASHKNRRVTPVSSHPIHASKAGVVAFVPAIS